MANSIHDRSYLQGRIEAGEAYDWYYPNPAARSEQTRLAITDGVYAKPWVFRPKDLRSFWSNAHVNRPGGVEASAPTPWVPQSKPIWLIELGCPAVDKGTNSPNLFRDPKSSASALKSGSNAARDDLIQRRMLEAYLDYRRVSGTHNPASTQSQGPMIDPDGTHLWCWDARPSPAFPALGDVWADAPAWSRGHWLNGRVGAADLADVIEVLCHRAGVLAGDASTASGLVARLAVDGPATARSALEPLMQAHALVARARAGKLHFEPETQAVVRTIDQSQTVWPEEGDATSVERPDAADLPAQARLQYIDAAQDYRTAEAVARVQDPTANATLALTAPMVVRPQSAQRLAKQALPTARAAQRPRQLASAPACLDLEPGDVVRVVQDPAAGDYRIAAIKDGLARHLELLPLAAPGDPEVALPMASLPAPVSMATPKLIALDLPPLPGSAEDDRPFAAVWATPWSGPIDVYWGDTTTAATVVARVDSAASIGTLQWALWPLPVGRWGKGNRIRVHMPEAALESLTARAVLDGANVFALQAADGVWEIIQARQAVLVEPHVYELSGLLRAPTGHRPKPGVPIPVGAPIVRVDQALTRLNLASSDLAI